MEPAITNVSPATTIELKARLAEACQGPTASEPVLSTPTAEIDPLSSAL